MFIEGSNTTEIAAYLNSKGCFTPYRYRYRDRPEKLAERPYLKWTTSNINSILTQDVYTGKYTLKKREKAYFRNEDIHHNPKEDWLVFKDHHPAIISKEDFARAMEIRENKHKSATKSKEKRYKCDNLLKGKVFCKCGAAYGIGRKILFCNRRKDYGNDICNNENIAADTLYDTVFSVIQEQISFLLEEDRIIKDVSRTSDTLIRKNNLLAHQAEKQRAIQRIYTLKSELYSDYIDDILTEQEYIALNREYSAQIESIESELVTITRSIQSLEHSPVDSEKIKTIIQKYRNKHKLSQEMVDALIEKVIIYDSKNIEVQLSFDDVLQETLAKREERQAVLNG